jgi:hypothetical protein
MEDIFKTNMEIRRKARKLGEFNGCVLYRLEFPTVMKWVYGQPVQFYAAIHAYNSSINRT